VARDKTVLEAAREAVFAAPGRQVIAVSYDTGHDQSVQDMVLAVTDGLGGVDILVSAAARPNTGTMAGIDAFDDSELSEHISVKVLGTATTRRPAAARTRPGRRARDEPQHRLASPAAAPRRRGRHRAGCPP
jgi:NAD(P)-dependent dehydrogenase (short-subunit alcohol dehydrogenase family)